MTLSANKLQSFYEFIWRAMGDLSDDRWRVMLDPEHDSGAIVRSYYRALAGGQSWDAMIEFMAPLGSDLLPERLQLHAGLQLEPPPET